MRSAQEDITLLDDYIKGRLDDEAKSALELRLAADPDLLADLADLKVLQQGMRAKALAGKLEMMNEWEEEGVRKGKGSGNWKKWMIIIFFMAALGYLLYDVVIKPKNGIPDAYQSLYATEFDSKMILHSTKRSAGQQDVLTPEQRRAYEMYSIQLFEDAIPLLADLWQTQKDTLALFYLGVSQVGAGHTSDGLEILKKQELKTYSEQTNLFFNH